MKDGTWVTKDRLNTVEVVGKRVGTMELFEKLVAQGLTWDEIKKSRRGNEISSMVENYAKYANWGTDNKIQEGIFDAALLLSGGEVFDLIGGIDKFSWRFAAKGGQTIIGETMKRVSVETAKHPGSIILNNMPKFTGTVDQVTSKMMSYNRQWILQQMRVKDLKYIETVKLYYSFLEAEFGFNQTNETINGNAFYDVEFKDKERIISISYENIEDHLEVIVFLLQNGKMPDYDDKTKTLHLKQLNRLVMAKVSKDEINLNAEYFASYNAKNELERKLLKEAKELRLCLKHFNEL